MVFESKVKLTRISTLHSIHNSGKYNSERGGPSWIHSPRHLRRREMTPVELSFWHIQGLFLSRKSGARGGNEKSWENKLKVFLPKTFIPFGHILAYSTLLCYMKHKTGSLRSFKFADGFYTAPNEYTFLTHAFSLPNCNSNGLPKWSFWSIFFQ